ncbi:MvdC/MvdD family ATP grasp protein [Streptomyces glaucescens]|uniref:MvdC/MvdD family ATP grasp protein n=1 Tax=Streptomyces glaucescens TaxID=1907 RepID=UPI001FE24CF7|nr:hypothetical protein [Streptomyces glaucescens]
MAGLVLVVTALEDVTADRVIGALNEREVPVVRVDPADIGPQLSFGVRIGAGAPISGGRLRRASREVELGEVAAVYYRRPTPYVARSQHLPVQQRDFAATEARHGLGGVWRTLPPLWLRRHCDASQRRNSARRDPYISRGARFAMSARRWRRGLLRRTPPLEGQAVVPLPWRAASAASAVG